MGKKLIIKGANFNVNAIPDSPGPTPQTIKLGASDLSLYTTLHTPAAYTGLSNYVYACASPLSISGKITKLEFKANGDISASPATLKIYIFSSDKTLLDTQTISISSGTYDASTKITTYNVEIPVSAGQYIGYFLYAVSNVPQMYTPTNPRTDPQAWVQYYQETTTGVISAYPAGGSQTYAQAISITVQG